VVCLIDTEAKPEGSDKSEGSTAEAAPAALLLKRQKAAAPANPSAPAATYASGTPLQLQEKF
jgi:2-oxoglutarate dehydrogenase E2 component (dihydrolipoamide succinyltransferase)